MPCQEYQQNPKRKAAGNKICKLWLRIRGLGNIFFDASCTQVLLAYMYTLQTCLGVVLPVVFRFRQCQVQLLCVPVWWQLLPV